MPEERAAELEEEPISYSITCCDFTVMGARASGCCQRRRLHLAHVMLQGPLLLLLKGRLGAGLQLPISSFLFQS